MSHDAAQASAHVIEGAMALAKAETRLALSELYDVLARAAIAATILWAAVVAASVAIVLVCVSPLLAESSGSPVVLLAIALSALIAAGLGAIGVLRMRTALAVSRPSTPARETRDAEE